MDVLEYKLISILTILLYTFNKELNTNDMKNQNTTTIFKRINKAFFRKQKPYTYIILSLFVMSSLLSCNSDRKNKRTISNNPNNYNGDIDNDGIPNEFDIDYIEGQQIVKREEIQNDIKDTYEEEKEVAYVALKKQKKQENQNNVSTSTKNPKRKGSGFNIPKLPLETSVKRDMQLLIDGKKRPKDISKHFCNANQTIVANGKKMTLSKFYKSINGKKISMVNLTIELDKKGCVSIVVLEYKTEFLFKSRLIKDKPRRLTRMSKKIGF